MLRNAAATISSTIGVAFELSLPDATIREHSSSAGLGVEWMPFTA